MKVIVFGDRQQEITPLLEGAGFEVVNSDPDFVVSYGGDGTIMQAEYTFPGIPKIILRNSNICKKCPPFSNEEILDRVAKNEYTIEELYKLQVECGGDTLQAMDSIIVHNGDARRAIRYKITINGKKNNLDIIGDGIVVATPFGSTGYYRSITDSFFEVGMGVAFNNSTEQSDHMVIGKNSLVELEVTRGPVVVYADNQDKSKELNDGDKVVIKKSSDVVRLVHLE